MRGRRYYVVVSASLHRRIKLRAEILDASMGAIVAMAIEALADRDEARWQATPVVPDTQLDLPLL